MAWRGEEVPGTDGIGSAGAAGKARRGPVRVGEERLEGIGGARTGADGHGMERQER